MYLFKNKIILGWTLYLVHNKIPAEEFAVALFSPDAVKHQGIPKKLDYGKGNVLVQRVIDSNSPLKEYTPSDLAEYIKMLIKLKYLEKDLPHSLNNGSPTREASSDDKDPYIYMHYNFPKLKQGIENLARSLESLVNEGVPG